MQHIARLVDIVSELGDDKPRHLRSLDFRILCYMHKCVRHNNKMADLSLKQLAKSLKAYDFSVQDAVKELDFQDMAKYPKLLIRGYNLIEDWFCEIAKIEGKHRERMELTADNLHYIQKTKHEAEEKYNHLNYYLSKFKNG